MVRGQPTFLSEVMDTIARLKDAKGSPPDKIVNHLVCQRKTPLRNAAFQVKKGIKTGLKSGLIKEVGGKFKLGIAPRDYAIFRNLRQTDKGLNFPVKEHRRRKGRRSRSRRKRGRRRRRSDFFSLGIGDEESTDDYSLYKNAKNLSKSKPLPVKQLRRRRGKRRSRSRRRRARRRRRTDYFDSENLMIGSDESDSEPMDRGRRRGRSKRRKGRRRRGRRRGFGPDDDVDSIRTTLSMAASGKFSDENPRIAKPQEE